MSDAFEMDDTVIASNPKPGGGGAPHEFKRPQAEKPYQPPVYGPDDLPPDWFALVSLVFSIIGLMLRNKIASWVGMFACVFSVANVKYSEVDFKQIVTCLAFSVMGLVVNYATFGQKQQQ